MRILVVCVGRSRDPFADDIAHYERLLVRYVRIEQIELREAGGDADRRRDAIEREGRLILSRLPAGWPLWALHKEGEPLSSEQLAELLEAERRAGHDLCLVIGGPFGLDQTVLERADRRLSLGPATLPHQLARVVLLEQLFRAHKILAREPYHY